MRKLPALILLACAAFAQHQHDSAPVTRATLLPGLGRHHHPIATASPEAQKFFDEGLTLVYAFNHEEAIRSFERASALDPRAAMPLMWGRYFKRPDFAEDYQQAAEGPILAANGIRLLPIDAHRRGEDRCGPAGPAKFAQLSGQCPRNEVLTFKAVFRQGTLSPRHALSHDDSGYTKTVPQELTTAGDRDIADIIVRGAHRHSACPRHE